MFKYILSAIISLTILFIAYIALSNFYFNKQNEQTINYQINDEYEISFKYNPKHWTVKTNTIDREGEYTSFVALQDKNNPREKYISFRYEYLNNGDDTPVNISETGAPPWPPQPEDLIFDKSDDEYHYIGKFLGKKLYVTSPNYYGSVALVQELSNGKVTGVMPLLSKDKDRVNYYDSFTINAELGEDKEAQAALYKEFLQILKTLKIEKVK